MPDPAVSPLTVAVAAPLIQETVKETGKQLWKNLKEMDKGVSDLAQDMRKDLEKMEIGPRVVATPVAMGLFATAVVVGGAAAIADAALRGPVRALQNFFSDKKK